MLAAAAGHAHADIGRIGSVGTPGERPAPVHMGAANIEGERTRAHLAAQRGRTVPLIVPAARPATRSGWRSSSDGMRRPVSRPSAMRKSVPSGRSPCPPPGEEPDSDPGIGAIAFAMVIVPLMSPVGETASAIGRSAAARIDDLARDRRSRDSKCRRQDAAAPGRGRGRSRKTAGVGAVEASRQRPPCKTRRLKMRQSCVAIFDQAVEGAGRRSTRHRMMVRARPVAA